MWHRRWFVPCPLLVTVCLLVPSAVLAESSSAVPDWSRPHKPRTVLWAVPGELQIDPMTGKPHSPHVRDKDWRKANAIWSLADRTVRIAGGRNEWIGFQLIVEAAGEDVRRATVEASDLVAVQKGESAGQSSPRIPGDGIELFRVWYTEVTEPSRSFDPNDGKVHNALGLPSIGTGWFGDALIPMNVRGWGQPFAVPLGRNQAVWVDIKIPKGIPAGTYRGSLTVKAERAERATVDLELTVWDFEIPDKLNARAEAPIYRFTIPGTWGIEERSERALALERKFFRMARAHRFIPYVYDTCPDISGDGADVRIDWTFYDKRYGPYLDGSAFDDGIGLQHWDVPVETRWPSPSRMADQNPELYYARLEAVLRQFDQHFREKGWNPLLYVFFQGLDEPSQEAQFAELERLADVVHRASDRIKMRHDFYTIFENPDPLIERFGKRMDIWNISACFYPVRQMQAEQAKGKQAWFYQGSEPWIGSEGLDNDALGLRTWAWIGWKYRVDCWHNWCSGRWSSENIFLYPNNGNARDAWRPNGNGVMIYPGVYFGVDDFFGSLRLKAYRRGNTDYEYMVLLRQLGAGEQADMIVNSIIRSALSEAKNRRIGQWGDWSRDPDDWERARRKLAKAIERAKPDATATR